MLLVNLANNVGGVHISDDDHALLLLREWRAIVFVLSRHTGSLILSLGPGFALLHSWTIPWELYSIS